MGSPTGKADPPPLAVPVGLPPPVSARRERAAGTYFRAVRHRAALELARRKKALEEHAQPLADLGKRVAVLAAPCVPRDERDLGRRVAEAQGVVNVEVLQRVRTDDA